MNPVFKSAIYRSIQFLSDLLGVAVIPYTHACRREETLHCRHIRKEGKTLLTTHELYVLVQLAKATMPLGASMAEVGTYRGGSSKLLAQYRGNRDVYVFDSFMGLPRKTKKDDAFHQKGMYNSIESEVRSYMGNDRHIIITRGFFPRTSGIVEHKKFSFVHLDVDLYESTYKSLEFFYPRMVRGGIIVTHDYPVLDGVRHAFREFSEKKGIPIIEIPATQAVLVKT